MLDVMQNVKTTNSITSYDRGDFRFLS